MHRNGKRNLKRFPFLCLQTRRVLVDDFLTGLQLVVGGAPLGQVEVSSHWTPP